MQVPKAKFQWNIVCKFVSDVTVISKFMLI